MPDLEGTRHPRPVVRPDPPGANSSPHSGTATGLPPAIRSAGSPTNPFLIPRHFEALLALPKEAFDTAEEVIAAGWRVDGDDP